MGSHRDTLKMKQNGENRELILTDSPPPERRRDLWQCHTRFTVIHLLNQEGEKNMRKGLFLSCVEGGEREKIEGSERLLLLFFAAHTSLRREREGEEIPQWKKKKEAAEGGGGSLTSSLSSLFFDGGYYSPDNLEVVVHPSRRSRQQEGRGGGRKL